EEDHVVLVGLGSVGYRIADELKRAGMPFVAIERQADGEFVEAVRAWADVITGDGRAPETLEKARVSRAAAVIAATSDDTINLSVGLAAKRARPAQRAVMRMFDADFAIKAQTALRIDAALSPAAIAAPAFAAAALYPGVRGAF